MAGDWGQLRGSRPQRCWLKLLSGFPIAIAPHCSMLSILAIPSNLAVYDFRPRAVKANRQERTQWSNQNLQAPSLRDSNRRQDGSEEGPRAGLKLPCQPPKA